MLLEKWQNLVSSKVGVIRKLAPQTRGCEEPVPPYLYTATLSHFDFRRVEGAERIGAGKGRTEDEAIASAIGEAVERYCAFQWDQYRTFLAKYKDVPMPAISPAEYVLFSDRQYARKDFHHQRWLPDLEVTWIRGVELPSGSEVALPASMAYLVHPVPRPEDYFAPSTSNGLAAGPSVNDAILSGLCELIERDALLITWMNQLPAVELDLTRAGEPALSIKKHYEHFSVEVRAFVLPTDLPATTIMALSLDPDAGKPAQVVGLGCHPDPGVALLKALFEMCQGRPAEARRFTESPPRGRLNRYEDVKTLDDHSAFCSLPEQREQFAFLWRTGKKLALAELPNPSRSNAVLDLEYLVAGLSTAGKRASYVELTTSDIAGCGYHVVRTLVTELQPIHFGYGEERLGGKRLFEVPEKLGFADRTRTVDELNPCPHPLA